MNRIVLFVSLLVGCGSPSKPLPFGGALSADLTEDTGLDADNADTDGTADDAPGDGGDQDSGSPAGGASDDGDSTGGIGDPTGDGGSGGSGGGDDGVGGGTGGGDPPGGAECVTEISTWLFDEEDEVIAIVPAGSAGQLDCAGNCFPLESTEGYTDEEGNEYDSSIGDGVCHDGTHSDTLNPDYDCAAWSFDGGDCS